jgi:hypothetical protein
VEGNLFSPLKNKNKIEFTYKYKIKEGKPYETLEEPRTNMDAKFV